jgi:hypothetical protein
MWHDRRLETITGRSQLDAATAGATAHHRDSTQRVRGGLGGHWSAEAGE